LREGFQQIHEEQKELREDFKQIHEEQKELREDFKQIHEEQVEINKDLLKYEKEIVELDENAKKEKEMLATVRHNCENVNQIQMSLRTLLQNEHDAMQNLANLSAINLNEGQEPIIFFKIVADLNLINKAHLENINNFENSNSKNIFVANSERKISDKESPNDSNSSTKNMKDFEDNQQEIFKDEDLDKSANIMEKQSELLSEIPQLYFERVEDISFNFESCEDKKISLAFIDNQIENSPDSVKPISTEQENKFTNTQHLIDSSRKSLYQTNSFDNIGKNVEKSMIKKSNLNGDLDNKTKVVIEPRKSLISLIKRILLLLKLKIKELWSLFFTQTKTLQFHGIQPVKNAKLSAKLK
jgi:hypothetical protein